MNKQQSWLREQPCLEYAEQLGDGCDIVIDMVGAVDAAIDDNLEITSLRMSMG